MSEWISVKDRLPEVDEEKVWNKNYRISKDVLCYSKIWGIRVGRYFYEADIWKADGVFCSNGIEVEFWQLIEPPEL